MLREHPSSRLSCAYKIGLGGQPVLVFSNIEGQMLSPNNVTRAWGVRYGREDCRLSASTA